VGDPTRIRGFEGSRIPGFHGSMEMQTGWEDIELLSYKAGKLGKLKRVFEKLINTIG